MTHAGSSSPLPPDRSAARKDFRRAVTVSAIVGTALVALNQGDVLLDVLRGAPLPGVLAWKVPLTYLVPFLVSFGSSRAASRAARAPGDRPSRPE